MLVYGSSGIGKTVFGATAPKPLFLAVEEGMLSLADKNVPFVKIKNLQDMRDVLKALKEKSITDKNGKPIEYETIVIDSLTEVQQVVIQNITGGRQPSMNQWGDFSDKMAEILKGFASLDKHIIFTCLASEKNAEDDDGKEYTRFQPELFGKLSEKAQAMMDFVAYYYMKVEVVNDKPTQKRVLTFEISPRWKAKDRSGKMPKNAEPDFSKLITEYTKIHIGEGKVVGNIEGGMEAPSMTFPPTAKDPICSKEQQALIKEAWGQFMGVYKDAKGIPVPPEKHDGYLGATMKKHCGVDTTTKLRSGQADQFFSYILAEIKKYHETDMTEGEKAEAKKHAEESEPEKKTKKKA